MNITDKNCKKVEEGFIGQRMIVVPPDIKRMMSKNRMMADFHLTAIGFYPRASFHDRTRIEGSSEHILLYCVEGRGIIEVSGKRIELLPNNFIILPKNTPHHYKSDAIDPWSIYWVHCVGCQADYLYDRYFERYGLNQVSVPYTQSRIDQFNEVYKLLENSFQAESMEMVNIALMNFVASFVYYEQLNVTIADDDIVNKSIQFMKANIQKQFALTDLAEQQNLSVSHYTRLFVRKMGSPPVHYFNQLKIQLSCQYIYFSDQKLKEISNQLGFEDVYYFSRLFKKMMGMSPVKYRETKKNR